MNNYELTVVVSAKLDDEARAAKVDKVKEYIERFGGKSLTWTKLVLKS